MFSGTSISPIIEKNTAQQCTMKSRSLGKDEVLFLLDLISRHKAITTKATNATNNKLKEDAWKSIAQEFSAMAGEIRRPEQLRLKWENLKKAARKRSATIRQNNLKTGGGKSYIAPDETLDRVASMLGATCNGFTVQYGGDGDEQLVLPTLMAVEEVEDQQLLQNVSHVDEDKVVLVLGGDGTSECGGGGVVGAACAENLLPKKFLFNTPKSSLNKRRKVSEEIQLAQRDMKRAMAAYFTAKAEKVQLENNKLRLEIDNLRSSKDNH